MYVSKSERGKQAETVRQTEDRQNFLQTMGKKEGTEKGHAPYKTAAVEDKWCVCVCVCVCLCVHACVCVCLCVSAGKYWKM